MNKNLYIYDCKCIYKKNHNHQKKSPIHEMVSSIHEMTSTAHEMNFNGQ